MANVPLPQHYISPNICETSLYSLYTEMHTFRASQSRCGWHVYHVHYKHVRSTVTNPAQNVFSAVHMDMML